MPKIQPKKSLGQNFLTDPAIVGKIIASSGLDAEDVALEIGPGKGVLTERLAAKCARVVAVEIDGRLVEFLKNKFQNNPKVEIIQSDILKITNLDFLKAKNYKLIANLPYYITSAIIRKFLEAENRPSEMILMVQKEVAERIVAIPGAMSILAISVQYYAKPEILFPVPKTAFDPVPEVDSAVIRIIPHSSSPLLGRGIEGEGKEENEKFFRVVRAGFCAKRKTLANNLANSFHLERSVVEERLSQAGIAKTARAQELAVEDWQKLTGLF